MQPRWRCIQKQAFLSPVNLTEFTSIILINEEPLCHIMNLNENHTMD